MRVPFHWRAPSSPQHSHMVIASASVTIASSPRRSLVLRGGPTTLGGDRPARVPLGVYLDRYAVVRVVVAQRGERFVILSYDGLRDRAGGLDFAFAEKAAARGVAPA